MMKPRRWIFKMAAVTAVAVVAGVVAQDLWDDESLFAQEDLIVDESVTGTLPEGAAGTDDDLFDALFGGDSDFDDLTFTDDDLGDLTAVDEVADDSLEAFDTVDAEVTVPEDLFDDTVGTGAGTPDDLFADAEGADDWDADALLDDMFTTGDQDAAVTDTMDRAGLADVFDGELDDGGLAADDDLDDADIDDLFGTLIAEEPSAPPPAPAVDDDDWDFEDVATTTEPEKGDAPDVADLDPADAAADVDFDALFAELATTADPAPAPPEPVEEEAPVEEPAAIVEAPVAPAPPPAYEDELALHDDLFSTLAEEAQRAAQAPPPVTTQAPEEEAAPAPSPSAEVAPVARAPQPSPETPAVARAPRPAAPEGAAAFEEAERLRRVARENHAINSLDRAESAFRERDFRRAIQLYEEALRTLPRRDDLEPARARARRGLANANFRQAAALVEMGELEAALAAAQGAARAGHRRGPDAVRRIQAQLDAPDAPDAPSVTPPRWEQEDFRRIDREIEDWLRRGREAYLTGEYERAILAFESVLARDPENKEAIRMMRAAAARQYDRSTMEIDATRQRMMAAVRDTWNPRQYGLHEEPIGEDEGMLTEVRLDELQRQKILEKMNAIRIPEVNFRQANIRDVLTFLQQQSVEFDPAPTRAERTGVNIILQLEQGRRAAAAPAARASARPDPFGVPDAAAPGTSADEVLVTFSALDISLKEALDIVVDVANLKYRIRGNIVMVVPWDAAEGEIVHRMYDVLPSAIARLQDLSSAVAPRAGAAARRGASDFLALQGGEPLAGEDVDLRSFFEEMGVQWPARSSIKFVRGLGKLVVANTQENLAVFESILSILNVVPYQIEIEARFIEVAQTDVDSLGLEWMLTDTWQIAEMAADAALPAASRRRVQMNENASQGGFTGGNRFLTQADTRGPLGASMMDQVATVSSVLTNPELSMVLHALQQRGHTDLLSAPKITTQSGQQATIKVVTEYIYPTAFETSGIGGGGTGGVGGSLAGNNGGTVGAVVTPLDFQTREVGVILDVLPEVSPEGQMINLLLSPEVVSEPTWRNYGSTYTSFDPNGNPVEQVLNMEQPFFHTRSLRTNLLIYNGATVVMGGMITEVRNSVDDRVPLLGDIPVFGRLFRSKYDSSEKRNLLIFVTARLVDPAGRPLDRERLGIDQSIAERIVGVEE